MKFTKLVAKEPGLWETEDGRARVVYDENFETCHGSLT